MYSSPLSTGWRGEDNHARFHRGLGRCDVATPHLKELPAVFARVPGLRTSVDSMLRIGVNKLDEAPDQISHVKHPSGKENQSALAESAGE